MRLAAPFLLVLLAALPAPAAAGGGDAASRALEAYRRKDFVASAELFAEALRLDPGDARLLYDAACASALAGRREEAYERLERAAVAGYFGVASVEKDEDFATLRDGPRWQALLSRLKENAERERLRWANPAVAPPFAETLPEDLRIAGLSRVWWEVKVSFANQDLVPDVDWDALYVSTLPRVRAATSTLEYYRVLAETCAKLRDGHTNVVYPAELRDRLLAAPAVTLRLVEGRVLVAWAGQDTGLAAGEEVVAVEGEPVRAYAEKRVRPWQVASTPHGLDDQTYRWALLQGAAGKPVRVAVRDAGGKIRDVDLPRLATAERRKALPPVPEFSLRQLPDGVAHLSLSTFDSPVAADEFEKRLPELLAAKAWILDVRENGGGNSSVGWRILSHLADKSAPISRWRSPRYVPAYRAWGYPGGIEGNEVLLGPSDEATRFRGKVAVLASARTFSAAEDFSVAFRALRRGPIVGEPTGGSTGQPLAVRLPGGGSVRICTKRDTYADGTEWIGKGVLPDVDVRPTVEDVRAGRDPVLARAVRELMGSSGKS